jgi:hypothetical protein
MSSTPDVVLAAFDCQWKAILKEEKVPEIVAVSGRPSHAVFSFDRPFMAYLPLQ